ncbi:MAG: DUF4124 domain-containing protein [Wenzhouxiangella sp.]
MNPFLHFDVSARLIRAGRWTGACLMAVALLLPAVAGAQAIYKVVDEHGNVTYTDQRPSNEAEPMALPGINVVDDERIAEEVIQPEIPSEREASATLSFRIASPAPEAVIIDPRGRLTIELESNIELPPAAQAVIYINGVPQEPVNSFVTTFEGVGFGEHSLRAELQTASGRVLALSEEIYVRIRAEDGP